MFSVNFHEDNLKVILMMMIKRFLTARLTTRVSKSRSRDDQGDRQPRRTQADEYAMSGWIIRSNSHFTGQGRMSSGRYAV